MRLRLIVLVAVCLFSHGGFAQQASLPASRPTILPIDGKLPHLQVDMKNKRIRMECEALNVTMPLEFFCVSSNGPEHETVLRSSAKPHHLHLAMLMLGLEPGMPAGYSPADRRSIPPRGPALEISCEFEKDGKTIVAPAYRMMRGIETKKEMPPNTWVFVGSRMLEDGVYAADATGYLVSIVNFDMTVIDLPKLASSDNETLEWEYNSDLVPPAGTKVTMIIEPAKAPESEVED